MVPKDSARKAPASRKKSFPVRILDHIPDTGEKLPDNQYWDIARARVVTRRVYDPAKHCGVPSTETGRPCTNAKGHNTSHLGWGWCYRHFGCTAAGIEYARKERLKAAVVTYGLPMDISPEQALLDEVHRTAGHVVWLGAQIRKLEPDALTWGTTKRSRGRGAQGPVDLTEQQAAIPVLVQMYQAERAHLVKVSTASIQAGVSKKALELAQAQASTLVNELGTLLDQATNTLKLSQPRRLALENLIGEMLWRMAQDSDATRLITGEILEDTQKAPETDDNDA